MANLQIAGFGWSAAVKCLRPSARTRRSIAPHVLFRIAHTRSASAYYLLCPVHSLAERLCTVTCVVSLSSMIVIEGCCRFAFHVKQALIAAQG